MAEGALSALFFAAALWFPPVGLVLCLASPLPLAAAAWRRGAGQGLFALAVGVGLSAAAAGTLGAAMYAGQFAVGGYLLGLAVRGQRSPEVVVGSYTVVAIAGFWVLVGALALRAHVDPATLLNDTVRQAADQAKELLLRTDRSAESVAAVEVWTDQTTRFFVRAFPGMVGAMALLIGWGNAVGLRGLARRRGLPPPDWTTWRVGEHWIWLLIGSGLTALLAKGTVASVGINVFLPALALYFLQGLAIVQHLFETRHFPRLVRAVTYALLFFQLPVMLLVAGLGAFDLWVDFRSRWSAPPTKKAET